MGDAKSSLGDVYSTSGARLARMGGRAARDTHHLSRVVHSTSMSRAVAETSDVIAGETNGLGGASTRLCRTNEELVIMALYTDCNVVRLFANRSVVIDEYGVNRSGFAVTSVFNVSPARIHGTCTCAQLHSHVGRTLVPPTAALGRETGLRVAAVHRLPRPNSSVIACGSRAMS
jgi:hypothetical protein